jgi:hypothetical protein
MSAVFGIILILVLVVGGIAAAYILLKPAACRVIGDPACKAEKCEVCDVPNQVCKPDLTTCCVDDATCASSPLGKKCSSNKCGCGSSTDCPTGKTCSAGVCIGAEQPPLTCTSSNAATVCTTSVGSLCLTTTNKCGCTDDTHCTRDGKTVCNKTTGVCGAPASTSPPPSQPACTTATTATACGTTTVGSFCLQPSNKCGCNMDSHCKDGYKCDTASNTCRLASEAKTLWKCWDNLNFDGSKVIPTRLTNSGEAQCAVDGTACMTLANMADCETRIKLLTPSSPYWSCPRITTASTPWCSKVFTNWGIPIPSAEGTIDNGGFCIPTEPTTCKSGICNVKSSMLSVCEATAVTNNTTTNPPSTSPFTKTDQTIKSSKNNKCMNIAAQGQLDGDKLIVYDCMGANNELFTYDPTAKSLKVKHTGKCIGVGDNRYLEQQTCNGEHYQKWIYDQTTSQFKHIAPATTIGNFSVPETTNCIQIENNSNDNGAKLKTEICITSSLDQKWV